MKPHDALFLGVWITRYCTSKDIADISMACDPLIQLIEKRKTLGSGLLWYNAWSATYHSLRAIGIEMYGVDPSLVGRYGYPPVWRLTAPTGEEFNVLQVLPPETD